MKNMIDENLDVDFEQVDAELEKEDTSQNKNQLVAQENYSLEYVKNIANKRKYLWVIVLSSVVSFLLIFSFLMLWVIKTKVIKPNQISKITSYIQSIDKNELNLTDDEITYSPNEYKNALKASELKDLLYAKSKGQKDFRFIFYKKDSNGKETFLNEIKDNVMMDKNTKIYLRVSYDPKNTGLFSMQAVSYKDLLFKFDYTKFLFMYDDSNKIILTKNKTNLLLKIEKLQLEKNISFKEAFLNVINEDLKDVFEKDNNVNMKYHRLFFEKYRNDIIRDIDLENIIHNKIKLNNIYLDDAKTKEYDTIFRFYDKNDDKVYELKAIKGKKLDGDALLRIREKITIPNKEYYIKNENGVDFTDINNDKVVGDANSNFEITQFITDYNNPNSVYDFSKEVSYDGINYTVEKIGNKEYNVISIYPKLEQIRAYMVFKTESNEVVEKQLLEVGQIKQMPLDLTSSYINKNNKYLNPKKQYFEGWRVLNDGKEITYKNITNEIYYNLKHDIILEPIIKNKHDITINLPHLEYKPQISTDKNYRELTFSVKEDEYIFDALNKIRLEKLNSVKEFSENNKFIGMYSDENYVSEIDKNMTAKDYGKHYIYFRYEIVYYKANFSKNFKDQYTELVNKLNLFVPIDPKTDVRDGYVKRDIFFQKLYDQNKNNGLKEKLSQYSLEHNQAVFSYYGGVYEVKIADRVEYGFSFFAFDKITGKTIANQKWYASFEKIPSIEDAMSKKLDDNTSEKVYFPYITDTFGSKIYKVSAVSSKSDFSNEYLPEDLISDFRSFQGSDNRIRCRFFLKVEEYKATYKYSARTWGTYQEVFSKIVTTSNHPKNYSSLEIFNELNQAGYAVAKHQGQTYHRVRLSDMFRSDGQIASFNLVVKQIRFNRNNISLQITYRYYKKVNDIYQFTHAGSILITYLTKTEEYSYYDKETFNIFMEDGKRIDGFSGYIRSYITNYFNGHAKAGNEVVYYADGTAKKMSEIENFVPKKGMIVDVDIMGVE